MTSSSPSGFVRRGLPWVVAAGALLVFLLTLNVTFPLRGMHSLAVASGLEWRPQFTAPVHFLVTYPIRWLSSGLQPLALNVFAAACAALSLGLLARSVVLLPHDRTRDQRNVNEELHGLLDIRAAWLPPLVAVLACGLQLTFWENAIVSTGEAFDLLLLAYIIRALLEFRISKRDSWLYRAALVQGLGMVNNYAMLAFSPAFVAAVIWVKGLAFFRERFFIRWCVSLLAGLLFYLALPTINAFSDVPEASFGMSFMIQLGQQKTALLRFPRFVLALVGLTSLFPVAFIGIKWPAQFGDISAAGNFLTNLMMHVIHGVFLIACLTAVFDPPFGPRSLAPYWEMLPIFYLGALSIGYFVGYFLLVFAPRRVVKAWQRPPAWQRAINYGVLALVWLAAVAVPVGLVYKNFGLIRLGNQAGLRPLAEGMARSLPPQGAVVLADDEPLLQALALTLRRTGADKNFVLVHSQSLVQRPYHRHLSKDYPDKWPKAAGDENSRLPVDIGTQLQMFAKAQERLPFYYLQPTFGAYLELNYLKPVGLVYQMIPYPTNGIVLPPVMSAAEIDATDQIWKEFLASQLPLFEHSLRGKNPYLPVAAIGTICSRALDFFGVEIQRANDYKRAGEYFNLALRAYPDNPAAFINEEYNRQLQAGKKESLPPSPGAEKRMVPYLGNFNLLLSRSGPLDEPTICFLISEYFAKTRNFRQAAHYLSRTLAFHPDFLPAHLALASSFIQLGLPDIALAKITETRRLPSVKPSDLATQLALDQTEAWAYVAKNDLATAEKILREAQRKYPSLTGHLATLVNIYIATGRNTNALAVVEEQLRAQPKDVDALINHGVLLMQQGQVTNTLASFTRALEIDPKNIIALINRAITYLNAGMLTQAEGDYITLERTLPRRSHIVAWGLQEVYWRKQDRKNCLQKLEEYLDVAPKGTPEYQFIEERLKRLKDGSF